MSSGESYLVELSTATGRTLSVRPIEPTDADALRTFHAGLSIETTRRRYFSPHTKLSATEVAHFTTVDHDQREALVAFDGDELVGVARWDRPSSDHAEAEVAFVVADRWQRQGIGSALFRLLIERGRAGGIERFVADTLCENHAMSAVFDGAGLDVRKTVGDGVCHYVMLLS